MHPQQNLTELTKLIQCGEITPHEIRQTEDGGLDIFLNIHVKPSIKVSKTMENLNLNERMKRNQ